MTPELDADFNGLFGDVLCLSHGDTCRDKSGRLIQLYEGMTVIACEPESLPGGPPEELFAAGVVERAPPELACRGSVWVLRIDGNGVKHRPAVPSPAPPRGTRAR